jgi:hypothetical protein
MSSDAVASQRSDVPDLLGVPEAAALLRVGLTFAYESTAKYIATGSETEIPAIKVGRLTRVPRVAFERYMGAPITWPIPVVGKPSPAVASAPRSDEKAESAVRAPRKAAGSSPSRSSRPAASPSGSPAPRLFEV